MARDLRDEKGRIVLDKEESQRFRLIMAATSGDLEAIKKLKENGADIHSNNYDALDMASRFGHLDVVRYLVEDGADVYANNNEALKKAQEGGHEETVRYLKREMSTRENKFNMSKKYLSGEDR